MVTGKIHGCNTSGHLNRRKMLMGTTPRRNAPTETQNCSSAKTILKVKNVQIIFMDGAAQTIKFQYCRFYMVHREAKEIIETSMWQSQDKNRRWQEDWSNQITAIHIQKASLHLTTHILCTQVLTLKSEQALHFSPPLRKGCNCKLVSKKRVAPDPLAFGARNNGLGYYPQIVFPSQEVRMGHHPPGCHSQADDRLHGCPCQRIR